LVRSPPCCESCLSLSLSHTPSFPLSPSLSLSLSHSFLLSLSLSLSFPLSFISFFLPQGCEVCNCSNDVGGRAGHSPHFKTPSQVTVYTLCVCVFLCVCVGARRRTHQNKKHNLK